MKCKFYTLPIYI